MAAIPKKTPIACGEPRIDFGPFQGVISYLLVFFCYPLHWIAAAWILTLYLLYHSSGTRAFMVMYLLICYIFDADRGAGKGWYLDLDILKRWNKQAYVWRICTSYYPMRLFKTAELDPDGQYLFVTHPHGVFGVTTQGTLATFGCELDRLYGDKIAQKIRVIGLDVMFRIPFFREYVIAVGCCSSSRHSFERIFAKGENAVLNVGGAAEALLGLTEGHGGEAGNAGNAGSADADAGAEEFDGSSAPEKVPAPRKELKLVLRERKGFVRVAMQHGVSLVPCIAFAENTAYRVLHFPENSLIRKLQMIAQKKLRFSVPLFFGNGLPTQPLRRNLDMYVGAAVRCEKIADPTPDQVEAKHAEYCAALTRMFEEYKDHAGMGDWKLSIIKDPAKKMFAKQELQGGADAEKKES